MTGISRTGGSERGEFAVQQVLSLEVLSAMPKLPSANAVNALLPQSVRVFHITNIDKAFSARRMCESRTYEYLIPTYVFSPPPPQTGYPFRSETSAQDALDLLLQEANVGSPNPFGPIKMVSTKRSSSTVRSKTSADEKGNGNGKGASRNSVHSDTFGGGVASLPGSPGLLPSQIPTQQQSSLITRGIADLASMRDTTNAKKQMPKHQSLVTNVKSFFGGLKKRSSDLMSRSSDSIGPSTTASSNGVNGVDSNSPKKPNHLEPTAISPKRFSAHEPIQSSALVPPVSQQQLSSSAPADALVFRASNNSATPSIVFQQFSVSAVGSVTPKKPVFSAFPDDDDDIDNFGSPPTQPPPPPPVSLVSPTVQPYSLTYRPSSAQSHHSSRRSSGAFSSVFPDDEDDDRPIQVGTLENPSHLSFSHSQKIPFVVAKPIFKQSSNSVFPDDDDDDGPVVHGSSSTQQSTMSLPRQQQSNLVLKRSSLSDSMFPDVDDEQDPVQLGQLLVALPSQKADIVAKNNQQSSSLKRSSFVSAFPDLDDDDEIQILSQAQPKSTPTRQQQQSFVNTYSPSLHQSSFKNGSYSPSPHSYSLYAQSPQHPSYPNSPQLNSSRPSTSVSSNPPVFRHPKGPLHLLPTTEEDRAILKRYRITPHQLDSIKSILDLYRGTHDWHNYIPAPPPSSATTTPPPTTFHRITATSCSKPSIHYGLEWLRIQITSPTPLPKPLFRAMISLLILVVRTNTPRSVISASFSRAKIHSLPLIPLRGSGIARVGYPRNTGIDFEAIGNYVDAFGEGSVRDEVFIEEEDEMAFEEWCWKVDGDTYLYKHFLNARGVIGKKE
ncbi:tRNA pseudouridine synthase 1 [Rhizoclosmatium sp. JEL0117]|nr:tRNA pseudouridine synthase 1 [Rhizoclosmatium sp. JEL0117]